MAMVSPRVMASANRIVESPRARIGLVREPIYAARARSTRALFHRRDQGAPYTEIACGFGDEQVLQVAVVADRPARTMEQVVGDAAQSPVHIGSERVHR